MRRSIFAAVSVPAFILSTVVLGVIVHTQAIRPGQVASPERPDRDTPSPDRTQAPARTGRISGRVVAADTGRPIVRARVMLGTATGGGRTAVTDADGAFDFGELAAARYNLSASRNGYVSLSYGQRRPHLPGTPLQLTDSQHLSGIELRLPRGSVISGHVYDETGEPMPGTMVQVLRYQSNQGRRQLMPAGGGSTDDRGQYRIWGLMPGEYFVTAAATPAFNMAPGVIGRGVVAVARGNGPGFAGGRGGRAGAVNGAAVVADGAIDSAPTAYAPTYYPGVASLADARPVTVGLSAEVLEINFNVLLVRTARVAGRVLNPDGSVPRTGNVNLTSTSSMGRPGPGMVFGSRIQADGSFAIPNVPPGAYVLRARSNTGGAERGRGDRGAATLELLYASMPVSVAGDVEGLVVTLAAGGTISGSITFDGGSADPSLRSDQFRVAVSPVDEEGGPNGRTRIDRDYQFSIEDVPAGLQQVRVNLPRGWMVKSITLGGQDITDTPFELRGNETLSGMRVLITNRLTELNGTIRDARGTPVTDYTVLAFSENPTYWRPLSRHITTVRPDQTGRYQMRGLPPGTYHIAAIDPVQPGEWYDPAFLETQRARSERVTIGEGEARGVDLRIE